MTNLIQSVAIAAKTKDPFHPGMTNVQFTGTEVVGVDGYMLAVAPFQSEFIGLLPGEPLRKMKKDDVLDLETQTIKSGASTTALTAQAGDFPPITSVRRVQGQNTHLKVGMSIYTLEKIVAMLKKSDTTYMNLEFSDDPMKPIFGKIGNIELTIMPSKLV